MVDLTGDQLPDLVVRPSNDDSWAAFDDTACKTELQLLVNKGNASHPLFEGVPHTPSPFEGITVCQSFFLFDLDQ